MDFHTPNAANGNGRGGRTATSISTPGGTSSRHTIVKESHYERAAVVVRRSLRRWLKRLALRPGRRNETEARREELAIRHIHGEGIEIGAMHRPLWLPPSAHVQYVDKMTAAEIDAAVPADLGGIVATDVLDDAQALDKFTDASLDFVVANHVLEHIEDPVGALMNWLRVLRPGGVLLLTVPDARYTFDVARPRTTVEHVLRDHSEGPDASRIDHLREYARLAQGVSEDQLDARIAELDGQPWSIHFHVWELETFLELILALVLPARIELAQAVSDEFSVVLRKC
jgi:SAM-dependent methyltransferase